MKSFLSYLRWSNIKFSIDLSPFTWSFKWISDRDNPYQYYQYMLYVRVLPFSFLFVLDNGSVLNDEVDDESV